jgi:hypothetical protein
MTRTDALPFVSVVIDDALSADHIITTPDVAPSAVLVGCKCGFEPLFVAVIGSTVDTRGHRDAVDTDTAVDIATDYLLERKWFGSAGIREPDYVIAPTR